MDGRRSTGATGETIAAQHLQAKGYRILERNFRTREGELDAIALAGQTLVFCEVRTLIERDSVRAGPARPLDSIDHAKRYRLRRMARQWLSTADRPDLAGVTDMRFDAIGVLLTPAGAVLELEHLEAAF